MSEPKAIRVEIPFLPPAELDPNWRGHWSKRARAARQYRRDAMLCALDAGNISATAFQRAELDVTIIVADLRHIRDTDNLMASLKPAIDGCIDAGIIQDDNPDCLIYHTPAYEVDKERSPLTILEFRKG